MGIEQHFVENKRILVMGGNGLIGRGVVHLLAKNNEVHAMARFSKPEFGRELSQKCEKLWKVDAAEPGSLKSIPKDFDVVINQVVQWGIDEPFDWPTFYKLLKANCFVPGRVMEHFRDSGAKLIFGSTGGVYRASKDRNDLNREEVTGLQGGDHPYDDTKLPGEAIVQYFSAEHGTPAAILRYYWPACPYRTGRPPDGGRAGRTCRAWMAGKPTVVSQRRQWYHNIGYMADLAYATAAAADRVSSPPATYNVTGSEIVTCREVDLVVAEELGIEPIWVEADEERDMPLYLADTTLMARDLWKPRFGMEPAVRNIVRAHKWGIREVQDWMCELPE